MELGGVGRPADVFLVGRDFAATAAKLSFPTQKSSRGLGILTDSVLPAKAKPRAELVLVLVGAMSYGCVVCIFSAGSTAYESALITDEALKKSG